MHPGLDDRNTGVLGLTIWEKSTITIKLKFQVDAQLSINIQRTIAHTQPPDTQTIMNHTRRPYYEPH